VEKLVRAIVRAQSYIAQGGNLDDLAAILIRKMFGSVSGNTFLAPVNQRSWAFHGQPFSAEAG
jgi:hypothetical protein